MPFTNSENTAARSIRRFGPFFVMSLITPVAHSPQAAGLPSAQSRAEPPSGDQVWGWRKTNLRIV